MLCCLSRLTVAGLTHIEKQKGEELRGFNVNVLLDRSFSQEL